MFVNHKWLVLWSLWAARFVRQPTPIRQLQDGSLLRGQYSPDGTHQRYFGIPYASSEFKYRFKAPGPAPKWEGVFEATRENIRCPQVYNNYLSLVVGPEDCLVLNVYTPNDAWDGAPLPVMVFVHGGGFKEGSGSALLYGPDYLVSKGVVLVTINYRLAIGGFACLGIKEAPGNAGLKDQVAALKWVQKNIRAFGGNPDDVTLFGESAGGASVSYHLLSPMSKGLFHRAIIQSGSSLGTWTRQRFPLKIASAVGKVLGHNTEDPHELYRIFQNTAINDLIAADIPRTKGRLMFAHLPFVPCIEKPIDGVEPFITDTPYNILSKGKFNKVPVIIGSNSEEGYMFAVRETDETLKNIDFEVTLELFDLKFPSDAVRKKEAETLKKLYMGDDEISWETLGKLSKLHGEPYFNIPGHIETGLISKSSDKPVYNYLFKYDGRRNIPKKIMAGRKFSRAPGATHADELFYLFSLFPFLKMFEDKMIETMTTLWTNFAKYGTPTPQDSEFKWPPTSLTSPTRLEINEPLAIAPATLWTPTLQYWEYLYDKYRAKDL
uniref:Carboxylic ester hydrolase n=1 Tax=Helicoverpa armigera TaxID=29058 RepID=D5G3G3_HELAM|nr:carboxyl/choline esterase CCE033a [Helicoverpa armigera]